MMGRAALAVAAVLASPALLALRPDDGAALAALTPTAAPLACHAGTGPVAATAAVAAEAGWAGENLVTAVAVAGAESGYDPGADNPASTATGLWQVLASHGFPVDLTDPLDNAMAAHALWDRAGGWTPWTTWTSGAYRAHLGEAEAAVAGLDCAAPDAGLFGSTDADLLVPRANPRPVAEALTWARAQVQGPAIWYRRCQNFVAQAYGWSYSGTYYAVDHYRVVMPAALRHDRDRNPPPGALLYYDTGSRAGHVALYLGGGMIASNDIARTGHIDVVPAAAVEDRWGATYLGWAPPYFPAAG